MLVVGHTNMREFENKLKTVVSASLSRTKINNGCMGKQYKQCYCLWIIAFRLSVSKS